MDNDNPITPKKIIFILGMHRAGTSLIAKAVQVLGYELGNNLMPAKDDNPKGFWEDLDIFHFNERLLDFINIRWDIPSALAAVNLHDTKFNPWKIEAAHILQLKIENCKIFAVKDPRISLLLPFWTAVAESIDLSMQYVIVVRNPLDSNRSLMQRNQFEEIKGLVLWVNHYYLILNTLYKNKDTALFIDYQKILNSPLKQLSRLSYFISGINISKSSTSPEIDEFINNFIDKSLSHSTSITFDFNEQDFSIPGLTSIFHCLQEFTQSHWSRERAEKTLKAITIHELESENYKLQLRYFKDELNQALSAQNQSLEKEKKFLQEKITEEKDQFYKEIIQKKDSEFRETIQSIVNNKDHEFQAFTKALISQKDRESQTFIKNIIHQKDMEIQCLNKKLIDENDKKNILLQAHSDQLRTQKHEKLTEIHKKDRYIESLRNQHDEELESWSNAVEEIKASYSWKVTTPLRISLNILRGTKNLLILGGNQCELQATAGLEKNTSGTWITLDDDPQLILDISRTHASRGWYNIQLNAQTVDNNSTLYPEVFIDYGNGYVEDEKILLIHNNNQYKATVFFRQTPVSIRIDPCSSSGVLFQLDWIKLEKIPLPIFIATASINIYKRDRANNRKPLDIIKEKLHLIHKFGLSYTINNLDTLIDNNEENVDWGVNYPRWISEVETKYFNALENETGKVDSSQQTNKHAILIITRTLSDSNIDLSIESIQNQLLHPGEILILHKDNNEIYCHPSTESKLSKKVAFQSWANTTQSNIITLLKPGHKLSRYYLSSLEETLRSPEDYDLIYCDNDEISVEGLRSNPQFKPDWSPDFLIESNYIGESFSLPLNLLEITLEKYNNDITLLPIYILYNLAIKTQNTIKHIPHILVHNNNDNNNSNRPNDEQYAMLKSVVCDHNGGKLFAKKEINQYRFIHPLPNPLPSVAIIIPTKDKVDLLKVCVETLIENTDYNNYEIIVVDNESAEPETQAYFKVLSQKPSIRIISYNKPFNYSAINNFAVSHTQSDILCFLNNDIEIINSHWLSELVSHAVRPAVGCVGAKLYYPDGRVQHAGVIIGIGGVAGHAFSFEDNDNVGYQNRLISVQNYSAVTAACMVVKKELFCSIGGFNEKQLPVAFNDIDFCLRLKELDYQVIWTPYAELVHHESATRIDDEKRIDEIKTEVQYMQIRWRNWIFNDPAYNHHLSLTIGKDFEYSLRQKNLFQGKSQNAIDINPANNPYLIENNEDRIATIVAAKENSQLQQRSFKPGLSIIILTLEKPELIKPLLQSLKTAKLKLLDKGINMEVIVGDTGSTSSEVKAIYNSVKKEITIIHDLNYHFSRCNNQLFAKYAQFDSVLFLNNDVIFKNSTDSLYRMHEVLFENDETGIVGSFLTYPDGCLQHGGVSVIEEGDYKGLCYHPGHGTVFKPPTIDYIKSMPAVTGACLLIRSDLFIRCGMFDPHYTAEAQDIDLCFQARRMGYKSILCYPGKIHHLENATRPKGEENNKDRARFVRKWALFYSEILQ